MSISGDIGATALQQFTISSNIDAPYRQARVSHLRSLRADAASQALHQISGCAITKQRNGMRRPFLSAASVIENSFARHFRQI